MADTETTSRAEQVRAARKEELLAAAREVLAEKGLEGTRVSEIVRRAGVSQGTFYLYFPSKLSVLEEFDGLMQEAIRREVIGAIEGTEDLGEAVETAVRAAMHEIGEYRDILGPIFSRLGQHDGASRREEIERPYYELVEDLIRQAQEIEAADQSLDPRLTARLIVGLIERAGADCFLYRPDLPTEDFVKEVARFIRSAVGI